MSNPKYTRVCATCGNVAEVSYIPKSDTKCLSCARKEAAPKAAINRWKNNPTRIRYIYFCPTCPAVVERTAKKKTAYCGNCSRRVSHLKLKPPTYYNLATLTIEEVEMRYFRICPDCPPDCNTKQVSSRARSGIGYCMKHKKAKPKQPHKPKPLTKKQIINSPSHIARQITINRDFKASIKEVKVIPQVKTDEEMMTEWLSKNEVTVLEQNKLSDTFDYKELK